MAIVRIHHPSWTLLASLNPQKYIILVLRVMSRYLVTLLSVCWAFAWVCVCVCVFVCVIWNVGEGPPSGCIVNLTTYEENGTLKFRTYFRNFLPLKYVITLGIIKIAQQTKTIIHKTEGLWWCSLLDEPHILWLAHWAHLYIFKLAHCIHHTSRYRSTLQNTRLTLTPWVHYVSWRPSKYVDYSKKWSFTRPQRASCMEKWRKFRNRRPHRSTRVRPTDVRSCTDIGLLSIIVKLTTCMRVMGFCSITRALVGVR